MKKYSFDDDIHVKGKATFHDTVVLKGGLEIACGPVRIKELEVKSLTVANLNTTKQNLIPRININTVSPIGLQGNLVYNTPNNRLYVSNGTTWKLVTTGNPINGTFSVGVGADFPTITDLTNFLRGNFIEQVTVNIRPGTYNENLDLNALWSTISQGVNPPSPVMLIIPGFTIVGDTRYVAGMAYVDGALNNYNNRLVAGAWQYKLGTPYGRIDLIKPASNQLQVVITAIPASAIAGVGPGPLEQPIFTDPTVALVPGDRILLYTDTGTVEERNIVAIAGNVITFDGADVAIGSLGSAIVFCPNVLINNNPAIDRNVCRVQRLGVSLQGLWFRINAGGDGVLATDHAYLNMQNCLIDDRQFLVQSLLDISTSTISGFAGPDAFQVFNTIVGRLTTTPESNLFGGHWKVLGRSVSFNGLQNQIASLLISGTSQPGLGRVLTLSGTDLRIQTYFGGITSQNVAGLGLLLLTNHSSLTLELTDIFELEATSTDSGAIGAFVNTDSRLNIGPATTGSSANFYGGPRIKLNTLNGSTSLSVANSKLLINTSFPLRLDTANTGLSIFRNSEFSAVDGVTYTNINNPRAVEIDSDFSTPNAIESPSNVFSNTASGIFENAYLKQSIDSAVPVTLTLDPGRFLNNIRVYRGKTYLVTSSSPVAHSITLTAGSFFVNGSIFTTARFNGSLSEEFIEFFIKSESRVVVTDFFGVNFL